MRKLTEAEQDTLLDLINAAITDGSYYGVKHHYYERLGRLLDWVTRLETTK